MLFLFSLEETDSMESYNPRAEKNPEEHVSASFPPLSPDQENFRSSSQWFSMH